MFLKRFTLTDIFHAYPEETYIPTFIDEPITKILVIIIIIIIQAYIALFLGIQLRLRIITIKILTIIQTN